MPQCWEGLSCLQFVKPSMSGHGPTLPSAASERHGSYLGISCRQWGRRTTAEDDPLRKSIVLRSGRICTDLMSSRCNIEQTNFGRGGIIGNTNRALIIRNKD